MNTGSRCGYLYCRTNCARWQGWGLLPRRTIHNGRLLTSRALLRRKIGNIKEIHVQLTMDGTLGGKYRMQFILGVILFVVVIGVLDSGVPWPRCGTSEVKQ